MNVFLRDATFKPLDRGFRQRPTADATPNPIERPALTRLLGEVYIFSEDQVVEAACQSHKDLTSEKSVIHNDGMVLKDVMWGVISESDETLMSEASPFNVWPEVCEVDNEVQEMPTVHVSSIDYNVHDETARQRFPSQYFVGNLLGTRGCGSGNGPQVAIKCIPEKDSYLHINVNHDLEQRLRDFKLQHPTSKANYTLMPETSHQSKVGDLQSRDMAAQTSEDAVPEHMDSQQILKALKKHFALR